MVSGGRVASATISQLSKPTIETLSGTAMPRSRSASATPRAIWSLPQKIASGGAAARAKELRDRLAAPALRPDAGQIVAVGLGEPVACERLAVSVAASPHRLEPLRPGDMRDAPAAELDEMLDRERRSALVVGHEAECARLVGLRIDVEHRNIGAVHVELPPRVGAARR